MLFQGHRLSDLDPEALDRAEAYIIDAIRKTAAHYELMVAAYEEIGLERERREHALH